MRIRYETFLAWTSPLPHDSSNTPILSSSALLPSFRPNTNLRLSFSVRQACVSESQQPLIHPIRVWLTFAPDNGGQFSFSSYHPVLVDLTHSHPLHLFTAHKRGLQSFFAQLSLSTRPRPLTLPIRPASKLMDIRLALDQIRLVS